MPAITRIKTFSNGITLLLLYAPAVDKPMAPTHRKVDVVTCFQLSRVGEGSAHSFKIVEITTFELVTHAQLKKMAHERAKAVLSTDQVFILDIVWLPNENFPAFVFITNLLEIVYVELSPFDTWHLKKGRRSLGVMNQIVPILERPLSWSHGSLAMLPADRPNEFDVFFLATATVEGYPNPANFKAFFKLTLDRSSGRCQVTEKRALMTRPDDPAFLDPKYARSRITGLALHSLFTLSKEPDILPKRICIIFSNLCIVNFELMKDPHNRNLIVINEGKISTEIIGSSAQEDVAKIMALSLAANERYFVSISQKIRERRILLEINDRLFIDDLSVQSMRPVFSIPLSNIEDKDIITIISASEQNKKDPKFLTRPDVEILVILKNQLPWQIIILTGINEVAAGVIFVSMQDLAEKIQARLKIRDLLCHDFVTVLLPFGRELLTVDGDQNFCISDFKQSIFDAVGPQEIRTIFKDNFYCSHCGNCPIDPARPELCRTCVVSSRKFTFFCSDCLSQHNESHEVRVIHTPKACDTVGDLERSRTPSPVLNAGFNEECVMVQSVEMTDELVVPSVSVTPEMPLIAGLETQVSSEVAVASRAHERPIRVASARMRAHVEAARCSSDRIIPIHTLHQKLFGKE